METGIIIWFTWHSGLQKTGRLDGDNSRFHVIQLWLLNIFQDYEVNLSWEVWVYNIYKQVSLETSLAILYVYETYFICYTNDMHHQFNKQFFIYNSKYASKYVLTYEGKFYEVWNIFSKFSVVTKESIHCPYTFYCGIVCNDVNTTLELLARN